MNARVCVRRYNVYQVARSLGLGRVNVVYMDGHTQGPMDEVWRKMSPDVQWIKAFPPNTCFKKAIFVPFGYALHVTNLIMCSCMLHLCFVVPSSPPFDDFELFNCHEESVC